MDEALNLFFQGINVSVLEDYSDFDYLEIPKRVTQQGPSGLSYSPKLDKQFPVLSVEPEKKKTVMFTIPAYTIMLFGLVGVASYFHSLVTKEDQVKMNEVDAPNLFNEAQQTLDMVCFFSSYLYRVLSTLAAF